MSETKSKTKMAVPDGAKVPQDRRPKIGRAHV